MSYWRSLCGEASVLRAAVLGVVVLMTAAWPLVPRAQVLISGPSTNPDGGNPNDPLAVTACNGAPQIGVVYRNSESRAAPRGQPHQPEQHDRRLAPGPVEHGRRAKPRRRVHD